MARRVLVFMLVLSIVLSMLVMIYAYPIGHRAVRILVEIDGPDYLEEPVNPVIMIDESYSILWSYIDQFKFEEPYVLAAYYDPGGTYTIGDGLYHAVVYLNMSGHKLWINLTDVEISAGGMIRFNILIAEKSFIESSYLGMTDMHYASPPSPTSLPLSILSYGYVPEIELRFHNTTLRSFDVIEYTGHSNTWKSLILYPYAVQDNPDTCTRTTYYVAGGYATPYIDYPLKITISYPETVENAQIRIVLNQTNFIAWNIQPESIYFKDMNGDTLYYWIQEWDPSKPEAIIWINTTIPNTIYMYYGEGDYSAYNDPRKVFFVYDDFNDDIIDDVWTVYKSENDVVEESDGVLHILDYDDGAVAKIVYEFGSYQSNVVVDIKLKAVTQDSDIYAGGFYFHDVNNVLHIVTVRFDDYYNKVQWYDGAAYQDFNPPMSWDTNYHVLKLIYNNGEFWIVENNNKYVGGTRNSNNPNSFFVGGFDHGEELYIDYIYVYKYTDENELRISFDVEYPQQLLLPDYESMGLVFDHVDYYNSGDHDVITSASPNTNVSFQFPAQEYYLFFYKTESYTCSITNNGTTETWTVPDLDINVNMNPIMALTGLAVITTVLILLFVFFGEYAVSGIPISMLGLAISGIIPAWFAYLSAVLLIMFIVMKFIKGGGST